MSPRTICVVTGSRADYGLLVWPMREIEKTPGLKLCVAATGMHLSHEFGHTVDRIRDDGFSIAAEIETLTSSDTGVGTAKAIALGVIGFADAFSRIRPDLVMALGDRFETLAAAEAAMVMRIPIAHLCGGDVTEGALDDAMRHAITKMASLHFVTNAEAERRVWQLGEPRDRVFNVGSSGIDTIRHIEPLPRAALEADLGISFARRTVLVTFHPETLGARPATDDFDALLAALDALGGDTTRIFTLANADPEGRAVNRHLRDYVAGRADSVAVASLGQQRYLSLMGEVDLVIGNSSSGLYEAPSFGVPTVDIGDRQKGRLRAASVFHAPAEPQAIGAAIAAALKRGKQPTVNPYGDGHASEKIVKVLAATPDFSALVRKRFVDTAVAAQ